MALALLLCAASLGACTAEAGASPGRGRPSVLVVLLPAAERQLAGVSGLSLGIMSATQGEYSSAQFLLDVTQGARVASSAYSGPRPGPLALVPVGPGGLVAGWAAAVRRARAAPAQLIPGLLAASAGGAGYAGIQGQADIDAVLAADTAGRIAAVSLGSGASLLTRIARLQRREPLVVADLPDGEDGGRDLATLARRRPPTELLVVLQRVPDASGGELLWSAAAGLPGGGGMELSSATTNQRGLIAAVDLAPTILGHLHDGPLPAAILGRTIVTDGRLGSDGLRSLMARLRVIDGRRLPALAFLLGAWALLVLACSPWVPRRAWALRVGALGVLWAPVATLLTAAIEPAAVAEYAIVVAACLSLGALTDRLVRWPRAVIAPAAAAVAGLTLDALAGTQLLMRSLLGPDPIGGARFYGIGNELKPALAVLVLGGVAAALYPSARGRRPAIVVAGCGAVLAAVEGSARIGAGVGGVILVSASFAVASVMMLPGAVSRRRALIVLASPVLGLMALAALDLATARGSGHFSGSVLHARSASEVRDLIVRRYRAAWDASRGLPMALAAAAALLGAGVGLWRSGEVLGPVEGDPGWSAAFAGALTAGVVGTLVEDSGSLLFIGAMLTLACVAIYLHARPAAPRPATAVIDVPPSAVVLVER